ncbi:MAG: HI0074 family nucleotidyltransferase substrate-binding subunit [Actinomycetota bacterium]|nr:HI0074 family nucleotidyltransferase substrate-binding subunit [Actinomycetota bacterium]
MKDVLEYSLKKLKDACKKLEEGINQTKDELDRDGVIQRFEFTFELLWKALKIYLEHKGVIVKTPRDSFVEAFRINLISDEKIFLDMLEDINNTAYIYDEETSKKIFNRIKKSYKQEIIKIIDKLKVERE